MCVTGAGIHRRFMNMCNGANLAYPKHIFYEVNGFEGIDHLASGDDMLLMQKIAQRYPDRIAYIKNPAATIFTKAKPTLKSFLQQRIRWTTKSTSYQEWRVTFILAMVFFFCCSIVFSLLLIPFIGKTAVWLFAISFFIKMTMDYFFLKNMARFFGRLDLMKTFFSSSVLHLLYIVVVGILGNFIKKYEWKGRRVK
jgi:cellulose synthase/poly-beta-1,6-N-acetylglucosamine synthase-like glycosyltransferase